MKNKQLPTPLRTWFGLQLLALLVLLALLMQPAWADPPTRVARVAEVSGQAWWFDAEQREWQPLMRNQSLAEGDRLRVEDNGRVGLRIGASALWLDERSQMELMRLDEDRIDIALDRGALALRWVSAEHAREALVRTQEGRFLFERPGAYRIDQLAKASRAQAFEGRLRFEGRANGDAPVWLDAPEQAELWWDGGPRAERGRLLRQDDFGQWLVSELGFGRGDDRYARLDRPAYRYVSPDLTGADELDANGRWEDSGDYGAVWIPLRVAVDWAPYRHGRWTWTRHWGWTWVDDLPWGYATSHYGRWVHWRGRWCWAPGQRVVRPVFAPALVAWVGGGSVSVGVQIGSRWAPPVAWVPLAPREVFVPWYRHSPQYVRRFNPDPVTVQRPETYVHRNRQVPGAVSSLVVSADTPLRDARPSPVRDERVLRELTPLPLGPAHQGPLPVRAAQTQDDWRDRGNPRGRPAPPVLSQEPLPRAESRPDNGLPARTDTVRPGAPEQGFSRRDRAEQESATSGNGTAWPRRAPDAPRVEPAPVLRQEPPQRIEPRQDWPMPQRAEPQRQAPPVLSPQPMQAMPPAQPTQPESGFSRRDRAERDAEMPARRAPEQRFEAPRAERQPSPPVRMEPPRPAPQPQESRRPEPRKERERDKDDGVPRRDNR